MYRVDLPRPLTLVVALFSMVAPTSALAREFPAADAPSEDDPTNAALIGTFVPSVNVLSMPFLFRSSEHVQNVLDSPSGTEILNSLEPCGFVGLTSYDSSAPAIDCGVRSVNSLTGLKGLKIRKQPSELMSDMVEALGAEPIRSPHGQVPTGRARLIEGAQNNWPSFVTTHHCKYPGFHPPSEYAMNPEVQMMPPKAWQSLSPEDRSIFSAATPPASRLPREKAKQLEEHSRQQAESAGVAMMTDFNRKPLEGAMTATYDKARRDSAAADLIDRIRKVE